MVVVRARQRKLYPHRFSPTCFFCAYTRVYVTCFQRVATEWHKNIVGREGVGIKFPIPFVIDARALTTHSYGMFPFSGRHTHFANFVFVRTRARLKLPKYTSVFNPPQTGSLNFLAL